MSEVNVVGAAGLVADGVVRAYPSFSLGPIDLTVPPGHVLGVLGPNGAGKTTLLAALAGQSRPSEGRVHWNGVPIALGQWRYRYDVSYVRDVPPLYADLTVAETMAFVARVHPTWRQGRALELMQTFRLDPRQRVRFLSRGMKAKFGLLLGVSHDVQLLLLDEVTAGIDPETRDDIRRFLRGLSTQRRVSVVLSSHIFEDVDGLADAVLVLRAGRPVFHGAVSEVADMRVVTVATAEAHDVRGDPDAVGAWVVHEGRCVLLRAAGELRWRARWPEAASRPATLRDVYFAVRGD